MGLEKISNRNCIKRGFVCFYIGFHGFHLKKVENNSTRFLNWRAKKKLVVNNKDNSVFISQNRVPFAIFSDNMDDDKFIGEPEGIDESKSTSNLRYGTGGRRHYRPRHHHRNLWADEDILEPLNGKGIIGHNDGIDEELHDVSFHPAGAKVHADFRCISRVIKVCFTAIQHPFSLL